MIAFLVIFSIACIAMVIIILKIILSNRSGSNITDSKVDFLFNDDNEIFNNGLNRVWSVNSHGCGGLDKMSLDLDISKF